MLGALLYLLAAFMIAAGGVSLARGVSLQALLKRTSERLDAVIEELETEDVEDNSGWLTQLAKFGDKLVQPGPDQLELARELQEAGFFDPRAVPAFAALRLIASLMAAVFVFVFTSVGTEGASGDITFTVLALIVVYLGSRFALRSRANARKRQIRKEFTFVLDLFVLTIESGLSLDQALRHVLQACRHPAPLSGAALQTLINELDMGAPYDTALERWGQRIGLEESRELAAMFKQSLVHGTELSSSLRRFANDLSERRLMSARESVGKKSAQLTVVMVMFFLPALIILLGGPAMHAVSVGFINAK